MSTSLPELIEEFQKIMSQAVDLAAETQAAVQQIPDLSISEAPSKITTIFDMCAEGMKKFQEASAKAEEIQGVLR